MQFGHRVRSVTLADFKPDELEAMAAAGNQVRHSHPGPTAAWAPGRLRGGGGGGTMLRGCVCGAAPLVPNASHALRRRRLRRWRRTATWRATRLIATSSGQWTSERTRAPIEAKHAPPHAPWQALPWLLAWLLTCGRFAWRRLRPALAELLHLPPCPACRAGTRSAPRRGFKQCLWTSAFTTLRRPCRRGGPPRALAARAPAAAAAAVTPRCLVPAARASGAW